MEGAELTLGLLVVITALAIAARRLHLPYPIVLVVGGLAISQVPGLPPVRLDPELFFLLILPPLLYVDGLRSPWREFHANIKAILFLSVGLVLFTTAIVGWVAHRFIPGLPLSVAFALGAIVSPPDAVAAAAITEHLRVPQRISTLLNGESLVNDATGLVAFRMAVAAAMTGAFSWWQAGWSFLTVALGGIAVGLAMGWVIAEVRRWINRTGQSDSLIENTIGLMSPFAAYLPAERLGLSGVLAVVTTGFYLGWRSPQLLSAQTRLQGIAMWDMIRFLLNGLVFILIGLQLPGILQSLAGESVGDLAFYALIVCAAAVAARLLWVFPGTYLPRLFSRQKQNIEPPPPAKNVFIVAWSGMRGAVTLAAAFSLPLALPNGAPFPGRDIVIFLAFSVILFTLLVQGLTLPALIRWLGVEDDGKMRREEAAARLLAAQAAVRRIEALAAEPGAEIDAEVVARLRVEYEERIDRLAADCGEEQLTAAARLAVDRGLRRNAIQAEREEMIRLRNKRVISDAVLRRVQHDLDMDEARYASQG
jgi:CPA1 family monovalent cation:H+ antiporter